MSRRHPGVRRWHPPNPGSKSTIAVIERGDPKDDRPGLPFGFARALVDEQHERDGWSEHAELTSGVGWPD